jgi:cupin 2 domain-containing protein
MKAGNLFADIPPRMKEEHFTELLADKHVTIERIVSYGQASPPGFWYDEEQGEWVMVLAGAARLLFEGEAKPRELRPGDHVYIPARTRHRVEWTDPVQPTVWLAVHHT